MLASMTVQCLLKFLRGMVVCSRFFGSPLTKAEAVEPKTARFSDPVLLVDRLVFILQATLSPAESERIPCNCFATILETSAYDRRAWDAFTARDDLVELHYRLLLVEERPIVRYLVSQAIAAHCSSSSRYVNIRLYMPTRRQTLMTLDKAFPP